MAHYNFRKDLEDGKFAEVLVTNYLKSKNQSLVVTELVRARQKEGDLETVDGTVEVKFDKMAGSTSNLCFELANGKGQPTGIAATKAALVAYVVPREDHYIIYMFETEKLRKYILDTNNTAKVRIVNGGDRRAYCLALVTRDNIEADKVAISVEAFKSA
jgi:hypothetical protein